MRLACIYAVLDCAPSIHAEHLSAALAVWRYCEASAQFIFGAALGDTTADEIIRALEQRPEGLTRTDIRDLFGRNKRSAEIERALALLEEYRRARMVSKSDGPDRAPERWYAVNDINAIIPN